VPYPQLITLGVKFYDCSLNVLDKAHLPTLSTFLYHLVT